MQLIEVNSFVPQIKNAPHKIYVIEFALNELASFKVRPKSFLKHFAALSNIDDKTNISVIGLDGDKGAYDHSNVSVTHGIIMDFRPLLLKVIYWDKPTTSAEIEALVQMVPPGLIPTVTS